MPTQDLVGPWYFVRPTIHKGLDPIQGPIRAIACTTAPGRVCEEKYRVLSERVPCMSWLVGGRRLAPKPSLGVASRTLQDL